MTAYEQMMNDMAMWDVDVSNEPSDTLVFAVNTIRANVAELFGIKIQTTLKDGCYVVERVENETNRSI